MSEVFEVDASRPEDAAEAIDAAAAALSAGQLVVVPTETVYGIAARPDVPEATGRLFETKSRPPRLTLPVLVPAANVAWRYGERTTAASALASRFWPGPITLVLRRTTTSAGWNLGEATGSIGLRVPDHAVCLALLRRTGAMAATSANLSGRPPLQDAEALRSAFGDSVAVYLVLHAEAEPPAGTASTVVDATGDRPRILRPGPIGPDEVLRVASTLDRTGPNSRVQ